MWAARRAPRSVPPYARSASVVCSNFEPDLEYVLEHVQRAADRAQFGWRRVAPYDRRVRNLRALLLDSIENFGVVPESLARQTCEGRVRHVGAKELETTLCVPDAWQQQGLNDEIEGLAHQLAIDRLRDLDAGTLDRTRANRHPRAVVQPGLPLLHLFDPLRKARVR